MTWNLDKVIVTEHVNLPVDWQAISPSGRVFVEIGFGNGEFLEYLANTYPDVLIAGLEVSQLCAGSGAQRALAGGLSNIRIMHGDARFLLRHCFKPETAERVYMNFPCPWPKTRHAARRVTVPSFAALLNYLLAPRGTFELATDVEWYAREAARTITSCAAFSADEVERNPERPYVTKYERKWKAQGKDTWRLLIHKSGSAPVDTERDEEWPMEGEILNRKNVRPLLDELKGKEGAGAGGKGHWIVRDVFYSDEGTGLALVIASDDEFEQHFYLKFIENNRGGITVKIDSVGHPYRTPSMRAALLYALARAAE